MGRGAGLRLIFDIETDGIDDVTTCHSIVIKDVDTGRKWSCCNAAAWDEQGHLWQPLAHGLELLQQADELIGHNILNYDLPTLRKLYPPFNPRAKVTDTLILSRLLFADIEDEDVKRAKRSSFPGTMIGKHSLEAWGYRLGERKGEFGKQTDWKQWSVEMQTYCEQDVEVTEKLWRKEIALNPSEESVKLEHDFAFIMGMQEKHGFAFDTKKAAELYATLAERRTGVRTRLQETFEPTVVTLKTPAYYTALTGPSYIERFPTKRAAQKAKAWDIEPGPNRQKIIPFNPGSRDQMADRLKKRGWTPVKFTETGKPQVDETILTEIGTPEAKLLNEYLLIEKRIGQLAEGQGALLKLERKGRIHGRIITNGAVTGRCTHMAPNVAQTPAVQKDKNGVLYGYEGGYGHEFRSLYTTDPEYLLVGVDASGLELRCLAHYMAFYDGGEYAKAILEGDIHTSNQQAAGLATRDQAKTFIYAYLYGAGDEKIGLTVGVTPEEIESYREEKSHWRRIAEKQTKWGRPTDALTVCRVIKGARLKAEFERKTPALASLKASIQAKVKERGYLTGIDGRHLHVRHQHAALNTLLQSAGGLLMKKAPTIFYDHMLRQGMEWKKDFAFVAHIHDEFQTQVRKDIAEEAGKLAVQSINEAGQHFNFRIPIDGEYRVGRNWAETH